MSHARSNFEIAREVLDSLKLQVVSQSDIISRTKLPYFYKGKIEEYNKIYGSEKISKWNEYQIKLKNIQNKAGKLLPLFEAKNIPSPATTMYVAISLCGVGECGETSNRALVELIKAGCTSPIRVMTTLGKPRVPKPMGVEDYYEHMFLIIGEVPSGWDKSTSLDAFSLLSEKCVLLDQSLGIVGKAKDTEELLKDMFSAYEMNRIAAEITLVVVPDLSRHLCEVVMKNAKELSSMIKHDLGFAEDEKLAVTEKSPAESGNRKALECVLTYFFKLDKKNMSREEIAQANEVKSRFGLK